MSDRSGPDNGDGVGIRATMAAFGVVIGSIAAYALGRVLESTLFGIAQSSLVIFSRFCFLSMVAGHSVA